MSLFCVYESDGTRTLNKVIECSIACLVLRKGSKAENGIPSGSQMLVNAYILFKSVLPVRSAEKKSDAVLSFSDEPLLSAKLKLNRFLKASSRAVTTRVDIRTRPRSTSLNQWSSYYGSLSTPGSQKRAKS